MLTSCVLISSKSVNSATLYFAKMYYALITTSARYVVFNMRHDDTTVALEAAHIKWKQQGGPCEIPNGSALCAIHHKAFDKGSIGLDENMRVLVSDAVNGGGIVERLFWDFDGKTIALPQVRKNYPYEVFVEWHRKEVFRG